MPSRCPNPLIVPVLGNRDFGSDAIFEDKFARGVGNVPELKSGVRSENQFESLPRNQDIEAAILHLDDHPPFWHDGEIVGAGILF